MIVSLYTLLFSSKGKYYTFNSLSNSLIEIQQSSYDVLSVAKQNQQDINKECIEEDVFDILVKHHHLVENCKDEFLLYKSIIQTIRGQDDYMHLTIAPTMDCNFRCFYCFEKYKRPDYMNEIVMDSIAKYIRRLPSLKNIKITWFGGEPLMAKAQIRTLYHKLSSIPKIKIISSDIITTGYFIDKETIELFKDVKISHAQITLDGNKTSHNNVKKDSSCKDVFSRVIRNVKLLTDSLPDFHITFRINLTKRNANEYVELYGFLMKEFKGKNIGVAPAFVCNRNPLTDSASLPDLYFNHDECGNFVIDLITKYGIMTPFIQYPDVQMCECAIRDNISASFDPLGFMYKCWEKIGDPKYAVGQVNEKGKITIINDKELKRELFGADPLESEECRKCEYLPLCHGGCPIMRIQNEFENYNNEVCTIKKGKLDKFLKIHLRLKEKGFKNR